MCSDVWISKSLPLGHPQANTGNISSPSPPQLSLLDLGALSAARESWEYYSGARDLQSPDLQSQPALQKILEYGGSSLHQQAAVLRKLLAQSPHFGNSIGGSYLELANTVSPFWFREHIFRPGWMPVCIFEFWAPEDISGIVSFYWAKYCTVSSIANNVKCSKCLWLVTSCVLLRADWLVKKCFKSVPCTDLISSISTIVSP